MSSVARERELTAKERELGETVAAFWRRHRFAIAWTVGKAGEVAKRVRESWPKTAEAMPDNSTFAAGLVARRLTTRNPVVVARPQDPNAAPLFLVECDGEEDVAAWLAFAAPATLEARSSGEWKRHYYYRPPGGAAALKMSARFEGGTLNLLANAYLVTPPARHPSGAIYRFLDRSVDIAELPREIYNALLRAGGEQDERERTRLERDPDEKITAGGRHRRLLSLAGALRRQGVSLESGMETVLRFNAERCEPPKDRSLIESLVHDVWGRYDEAEDPEFDLDSPAPFPTKTPQRQPGLAEPEMAAHFCRTYGRFFRFFVEAGRWIVFDESLGRWSHVNGNLIARGTAKKLIRSVKKTYADPLPEGDEYKEAVEKWHANKAWRSYRDNVLSFAEEELPINADKLDRNPLVISFANGIFDLRRLTFRQGRPEDYITVGSPVRYMPSARSQLWDKVLRDSLQNEEEIRSLQCLAGYLLTGLTREELSWWFYGGGRNGKDTIVGAFQAVLGPELAVSMNYSSLAARRHEAGSGPSSDMARLRGARLAVVSEIKSTVALDDERLKKLTGGNRITARFMRENDVEFEPTHKLIFTVNDKPLVNVIDVALRERIVLVPFLNSFTRENGKLIEGLKEELHTKPEHLEAIAAFMVDGYRLYQEHGLYVAPSFKAATAEFLAEANPLLDFIETCLELGARYTTSGKEMEEAYRDYVFETDDIKRLPSDIFSKALHAAGIQKTHSKQGTIWTGARVKAARVEA